MTDVLVRFINTLCPLITTDSAVLDDASDVDRALHTFVDKLNSAHAYIPNPLDRKQAATLTAQMISLCEILDARVLTDFGTSRARTQIAARDACIDFAVKLVNAADPIAGLQIIKSLCKGFCKASSTDDFSTPHLFSLLGFMGFIPGEGRLATVQVSDSVQAVSVAYAAWCILLGATHASDFNAAHLSLFSPLCKLFECMLQLVYDMATLPALHYALDRIKQAFVATLPVLEQSALVCETFAFRILDLAYHIFQASDTVAAHYILDCLELLLDAMLDSPVLRHVVSVIETRQWTLFLDPQAPMSIKTLGFVLKSLPHALGLSDDLCDDLSSGLSSDLSRDASETTAGQESWHNYDVDDGDPHKRLVQLMRGSYPHATSSLKRVHSLQSPISEPKRIKEDEGSLALDLTQTSSVSFWKYVSDAFHVSCPPLSPQIDTVIVQALEVMTDESRELRLAAGMGLVAILVAYDKVNERSTTVALDLADKCRVFHNIEQMVSNLHGYPVAETALVTLRELAASCAFQNDIEARSLVLLVKSLGLSNAFIVTVTKMHLRHVAHVRGVGISALLHPHLHLISTALVDLMGTRPAALSNALDLLGQSRQIFLLQTLELTLPSLVINRDASLIYNIAHSVHKDASVILFHERTAGSILYKIYLKERLNSSEKKRSLDFYLSLLNKQSGQVDFADVLRSCAPELVYTALFEFGHSRDNKDAAITALLAIERDMSRFHVFESIPPQSTHDTRRRRDLDLRSHIEFEDARPFVRPLIKHYLIGFLSRLGMLLSEPNTHRSPNSKRAVVRSLRSVIRLVGGSGIALYSSQILATIQSALEMDFLQHEALIVLKDFVAQLEPSALEPLLTTVSSIMAWLWPRLDAQDQDTLYDMVDDLINRDSQHWRTQGLPKLASFLAIPRLHDLSLRADLAWLPKVDPVSAKLSVLIARIQNENSLIVDQALKELLDILSVRHASLLDIAASRVALTTSITDLFHGSMFAPIASLLMSGLMRVLAREDTALHELALRCIGLVGPLDPDRLSLPFVEASRVAANLNDPAAGEDFALYLIENTLVHAYRAATDPNLQNAFAFAIQNLLTSYGFTKEIVLGRIESLPTQDAELDQMKQHKWESLTDVVRETCGSFFLSSFSIRASFPSYIMDAAAAPSSRPIINSVRSHSTWVRKWIMALISEDLDAEAKAFFTSLLPVIHLDDVVARRLLPHIVVQALIDSGASGTEHIRLEMFSILELTVEGQSPLPPTQRAMCAQTVFELMDHLDRWLRETHQEITTRGSFSSKRFAEKDEIGKIESLLQTIPRDLVADAAIRSRAFPRALKFYESLVRGIDAGSHREASHPLAAEEGPQLSYLLEKIHECYAALEEPDGMEGITSRIMSPTLQHQIREHESTGRWTSAQSCWEVQLQESPDDVRCHAGLLQSLRNLGHFDSMRTHIQGVLTTHAHWEKELAPFSIDADVFAGDWDAVKRACTVCDASAPEKYFGDILLKVASGKGNDTDALFQSSRARIGTMIMTMGGGLGTDDAYRRSYEGIVNLGILAEWQELVGEDWAGMPAHARQFFASRFASASTSFHARETMLFQRRALMSLVEPQLCSSLWLESCKIARKAGQYQSAYSALLRARKDAEDEASVFIQNSKLLMATNQSSDAIRVISGGLILTLERHGQGIVQEFKQYNRPVTLERLGHTGLMVMRPESRRGERKSREVMPDTSQQRTSLAKATLLCGRWMYDTGRLDSVEGRFLFEQATMLKPEWEKSYYYLGFYCDQLRGTWDEGHLRDVANGNDERRLHEFKNKLKHSRDACRLFLTAVSCGVKFVYQALPRMLTIWFEVADVIKGAHKNKAVRAEIAMRLEQIQELINKQKPSIPTYMWLVVLPQLVSRISDASPEVFECLKGILVDVMNAYPQQALWTMASVAKSEDPHVKGRWKELVGSIKATGARPVVTDGILLITTLMTISQAHVPRSASSVELSQLLLRNSASVSFPNVIIPLQSSLSVALPTDSGRAKVHRPFSDNLPTFKRIAENVDVMTSMQRPKRITVVDNEGREYQFLCKSQDDLRKDARLMEFNSMIITLLRKDAEARRRNLTIRTFAVIPFSEEAGIIEWVPNTIVLGRALRRLYAQRGIGDRHINSMMHGLENAQTKDVDGGVGYFEKELLTTFRPVLHEWFLKTFPEPSMWLRARNTYSRSLAVMSIVGFVLGLGDRHCENIMLDLNSGQVIHVDFNVLFDSGRRLKVPEIVPFRLTQNLVDAMGVSGVEGIFHQACQVSLSVLRANEKNLMSVLETFIHDPLVEWAASRKVRGGAKSGETRHDAMLAAHKFLQTLVNKLRGIQPTSDPESKTEISTDVKSQVGMLIREARHPRKLAKMYRGWMPFF